MNEIREVMNRYNKALNEKNVDMMVALYTDDVFIYDAWEEWSLTGTDALRKMVEEWFFSIGDETADVEFQNVSITKSDTVAFARFDAKFIGFDMEKEPYKSITNRFTFCLVKEDTWKIKHQHSSMPRD